jgi:perosamine synthetase
MIVTKHEHLKRFARQFINQGRDNSGDVIGHGFNFGMVNQNAALGLSQMGRIDEFLKLKKDIFRRYFREIDRFSNFHCIINQKYFSDHSQWFTAVKIDRAKKPIPKIQEELKAKGIPTRRIFKPLKDLPVASELYRKGICLPGSTLNTLDDIEYVAKTLMEVLT